MNSTPPNPATPWAGPAIGAAPAVTHELPTAFLHPESHIQMGIKSLTPEFTARLQQIGMVGLPADWSDDLRTFQEALDGSVTYKILGVEELRPGNTTLIYIVMLGR